MTNTENFNLNIPEGSDKVNLLTQYNPNFEDIDEQMKTNLDQSVTIATEIKSGTIHALNRKDSDSAMIRFKATSRFDVGDTFTVDGVQVSALLTSGEQLPDGAYIIGSEVLCVLVGTLLTFYISGAVNAQDSAKLGGELPSHYATAEEVERVSQTATAAGEQASKNAADISQLTPLTNINTSNSKVLPIAYNTTNEYVAETDGYLKLTQIYNSASYVILNLVTPGGKIVATINHTSDGVHNYESSIFVRKGLTIRTRLMTNTNTQYVACTWTPLDET